MPNFERTLTLAITGASGAQYGLRLLQCLLQSRVRVFLMVSEAARIVINTETDLKLPETLEQQQRFLNAYAKAKPDQLVLLSKNQWFAPVASGSGAPRQMVVCPCSTGTLSSIATGACDNLIERSADVALKERHQLIVVLRETPLSAIHLEHMLKLTNMGVTILPASPAFYHQPKTIGDMVDFVVARILNQLGIAQNLLPGWGAEF